MRCATGCWHCTRCRAKTIIAQGDCIPSRLKAGEFGRITPGEANNVRANPSSSAELLGQIPGGAAFAVTGDAICQGSRLWVEVSYADFQGWTVEANGTDVWAVPYDAEMFEDDFIRFIYPTGYVLDLSTETVPAREQMGGLYPVRQQYTPIVTEDDIIPPWHQLIEIMPVAGITESAPTAFESLQKLQQVLANAPDLSAPILEGVDPNAPQADTFLPRDPLVLGARRMLVSSAQPVTLQNGSGVAFITMYAQDLLPVHNYGLFFNVLALSRNDDYYVVLRLPIRTDQVINNSFDFSFPANWEAYYPQHIAEMTDLLNGLSSDEWEPSLDTLLTIAESIYIKGDIPELSQEGSD